VIDDDPKNEANVEHRNGDGTREIAAGGDDLGENGK
jgi:hypothetical protein